ncbi:MAG TPA: type II toxin-antitoxin system HicA family toxin [Thermodesulfobacteriota bacterium]|nr:type II toxin-antitoxin system HicA family toxin [Thermodesulfobacteriota bacterium]
MGTLAGFKYKEIVRKLKKAGFEFDRNAKGSPEIWWNPVTRARTTVPNHPGDMPEAPCAPSSSRPESQRKNS